MKHLASTLLAAGGFLTAPTAMAASLIGLWNFSNAANIGQATVGSPLAVVGTAPTHSATLSGQNGVITTVLGPTNYLTMTNPVGANGGGTKTNQFTLLIDVLSPVDSQAAWRCFLQTDPGNVGDGDYFIRNNNQQIGFGTIGYSGDNFPETQWTRLIIAVDNGGIVAYTDGSLFFTHPTNIGVDSRLSLAPTALLFADEDGENAPLNISTVAYWSGILTANEISALGGAGRTVPEPGAATLALAAIGIGLRRRRR